MISLPFTIMTTNVAERIEDATEMKNNSEIFSQISGLDLIGKKLMIHNVTLNLSSVSQKKKNWIIKKERCSRHL